MEEIWKIVYKTDGELSTKSAILKQFCQFEDPHRKYNKTFQTPITLLFYNQFW